MKSLNTIVPLEGSPNSGDIRSRAAIALSLNLLRYEGGGKINLASLPEDVFWNIVLYTNRSRCRRVMACIRRGVMPTSVRKVWRNILNGEAMLGANSILARIAFGNLSPTDLASEVNRYELIVEEDRKRRECLELLDDVSRM
jgi:hypothetical protein